MKPELEKITQPNITIKPRSSPLSFSLYNDGDVPVMLDGSPLSFIFVLQGEVEFSFKTQANESLKSSEVMVINKKQLLEVRCKSDTIIIEFEALPRIEQLLRITSRTFGKACSEVVQFDNNLYEWCDAVMSDIACNQDMQQEHYELHCRTLVTILLDRKKELLGTLYIPLYACSIHCDSCRNDG